MKNKEKKSFVYTEYIKTEQGTTFISILISLVSIVITTPLVIHFLTYIHVSEADEDLPIQHFLIFLRNDVLSATDVSMDGNNRIYFHLQDGKIARVEQYKNMIRRRVDEKGHEVYLRDIED